MTRTNGDAPGTDAAIDERLADEAIRLAERWVRASGAQKPDPAARRLAALLRDPKGLRFALRFVDGVIRPEDPRVAAATLRELARGIPRSVGLSQRVLLHVGARAGRIAPAIVIPIARAALRRMVRHLVIDARDAKLGPALQRLRADGQRLNVNLLGETVLGEREAARRRAGTARLLHRADVDYVSIKVSAMIAPASPWAFDETVAHAVETLAPLYRIARDAPTGPKFINLDMEEYKDLDLTLAVFTRLLERDEFRGLTAGVVLQAYLPDALGALRRLQRWADERVAEGGAPIKVRVVKGANLPMERVDAALHDWPLATWHTKQETDAAYKAVLEQALRPQHVAATRIGLAGHNLYDIAFGLVLARRRGVAAAVDLEMLLGMATAQAAAVRRDVGSLILYTPVVHPDEFDVAITYLVRRLEEGASPENFMASALELAVSRPLLERERERFLASLRSMPKGQPAPHRVPQRDDEQRVAHSAARSTDRFFANEPDTDPAVAVNRAWVADVIARMPASRLGEGTAEAGVLRAAPEVDAAIERGRAAAAGWRALGADGRAAVLRRAGEALAARRGALLEVMGAECGKVIEQGDAEVSEAVDFARYYAEAGRRLDRVEGAEPIPAELTVVAPPWNFPVAIPAGTAIAALATGSAVLFKPAPEARRSGAVVAECLWEAGVPRDVLQYVQLDERELGPRLIAHPGVDRVILTGAYETAELFRRIRPDLPIVAETSGKNAIIVTASADFDLAARDIAASAFGHAGQKCSAASLLVLVGSAARSARLHRQVLDAVTSMPVGMPWQPPSRVGPLIAPPSSRLRSGLTELESGERWVLEPRSLDAQGRLWSPGIRAGVRPGSRFHRTEYFGPVLGVMTARDLDEAIDVVNAVEYGLTSGLHSLDAGEIARWLDRIEAGNLSVNRGITGAIVQRQPFGGWKKSSVGTGAKAGGPNTLLGLTRWRDAPPAAPADRDDDDPVTADAMAAAAGCTATERAWLASALSTDRRSWRAEFGRARDAAGLAFEQNVLRYRPASVSVRLGDDDHVALVRVAAAGARVGAHFSVSSVSGLPAPIRRYLHRIGAPASVESETDWAQRTARSCERGPLRLRTIGVSAENVLAATGGSPAATVFDGDVVTAGRIELLTFLREQSVSITAHRFGAALTHEIPALAPPPPAPAGA